MATADLAGLEPAQIDGYLEEPLNDFAYLYLQSQTAAFRRINQGMGQPNLNTPIIASWYFPLPPLSEQRRIVARVDELMKLCDELESHLNSSQTERHRLLEAVLRHALDAAKTNNSGEIALATINNPQLS